MNDFELHLQIQGLIASLLEYSTRILRLDEHQQLRLFIEKLKQHRPFTASGIFTIDLGIAGPVMYLKEYYEKTFFVYSNKISI